MLTDYEQDIVDNVAKFGWQCTSVSSDGQEPGFSYTIGLWETLATPELIVFGLDLQLMFQMLGLMYDRLRAGEPLADGARWSDLLRGFDCITRPVHPSQVKRDYFNSALWYRRYRTGIRGIEAYQIFWPGAADGLFPWEAGADAAVRDSQPLLYLSDEQGLA